MEPIAADICKNSTRAERHAAGKQLRTVVPRESHADYTIEPYRDPLPILTASDPQRVQSLVPERYKRMAVSPFSFYRGAAALMAHDLAEHSRPGIVVQGCGDCHLANFGAFSSPEGLVLFDINDFDETLPGIDFTVDLKRLVASIAIAAQDAGLSDRKAHALAAATSKAYRDFMSFLATRSPLEIWQTRMDLDAQLQGLGDADLETELLEKLLKAEKKGKLSAEQPHLQTDDSGQTHFVDKPPFIFHTGADGLPVGQALSPKVIESYKASLLPERALLLDHYRLVDVAFKVVGVGSVGTYCAIGLMETGDGEHLVLQLKQALDSCLSRFLPQGMSPTHEGKRVVDGQRAMQAASDIFLGWTQDEQGRQFYVRQLKNRRLSSIGDLIRDKALPAYATLCGRTLARAHARTGDAAAITGYVGNSEALDEALASFAMSYASQTVLDHAKLIGSALVPHQQSETKQAA